MGMPVTLVKICTEAGFSHMTDDDAPEAFVGRPYVAGVHETS